MPHTTTSLAPRIRELAARPYLAIRCTITDGVPAAVDGAFPALFGWMGDRGLAPTGPPLIRALVLDPAGDPLELEVGVPVAGGVRGDGRVYAAHLPPGRYLTAVHTGAYRSASERDLGDARDELLRWMADRGLRHCRRTYRGTEPICAYDELRIGPVDEPDHTRWETELAYLIA